MWNSRRFARIGATAVRAERPDVVVADYAWPAAAAIPYLSLTGIPAVVCARGSDLRIATSNRKVRRRFVAALDASEVRCAVAQHLVEEMDRLMGVTGQARLVPNGVDTELFRVQPRQQTRPQLGMSIGSHVVLVVGHLIPRKDPLLAVQAFANAAPSLRDPRLVFVGEGPLLESIRRRAVDLDIQLRVSTIGAEPPDRLADWYSASDCLLLCSDWEGRPNVVLEALACGRPVVATRTSGTVELLESFPEMISDSLDPSDLANRIVRLVSDPPDESPLRNAALPFSWEASCQALDECLQLATEGSLRQ
jgi:glycosyltransferase involved in cell wall biosynthesis